MRPVWVDTDFGFDDLWALLLLRRLKCPVAGVSLVAGNAPLPQVAANALGAMEAYGFDWPVWAGADRPLVRPQDTAQRILGDSGMGSRGLTLPKADPTAVETGAVTALRDWLCAGSEPRDVLALGPLTNIALLLQAHPEAAERIGRLVWMGGSAGPGNHTPLAEFNAVADAEALHCVIEADLRFDMVDLMFCRHVTFGPNDMPVTDPLTHDLLGGYLDIALSRGRPGMAIYDPLAALAMAAPNAIGFTPCDFSVSTAADETYGATRITQAKTAKTRFAATARENLATLCLQALTSEET